jgi:tRNA pseudouridine13 synthase
MYILKQIPEDFIVTEVSNFTFNDLGRYVYIKVTKKNYNTLDIVKKIAQQCHIKDKDIGFAGSKDKHAVTTQIMSLSTNHKSKLNDLNIPGVEWEVVGYGDAPITLGDLVGNKFEITVRNIEDEKIEEVSHVVNYFDEQRFSRNNVEIGRSIVKKQFNKATTLIDEYKVEQHLKKKKNDHVGALRKLPTRLLRLFVNAYQSYLWNETVARFLTDGKKVPYSQGMFVFSDAYNDIKVPLIGFDEDLIGDEFKDIITTLMKEEDITFHDFIIRAIPEISLEGELRDLFVEVQDLEIGKIVDNKVKVTFTLQKGSYATLVIKRIIPIQEQGY